MSHAAIEARPAAEGKWPPLDGRLSRLVAGQALPRSNPGVGGVRDEREHQRHDAAFVGTGGAFTIH
jgi:hypothetical protein